MVWEWGRFRARDALPVATLYLLTNWWTVLVRQTVKRRSLQCVCYDIFRPYVQGGATPRGFFSRLGDCYDMTCFIAVQSSTIRACKCVLYVCMCAYVRVCVFV